MPGYRNAAIGWITVIWLSACQLSYAQYNTPTSSTPSVTSFRLTIPPLITAEPAKDLIFGQVEKIELPCIATGTPTPRYRWTKNGEIFSVDPLDSWIAIQPGVGTLIFDRPNARDEAIYQCFAENVAGVALTVQVNLRMAVLQPFQTNGTTYNNYPTLGTSLTLRCNPPSSVPNAEVFWATVDRAMRFTPIDLSDRVTQDLEGNLNFVNILQEDYRNNLTYTCIAQNKVLRSIEQGDYNRITPRGVFPVYYTPAIMWQSPTQQVAIRGATITLKCIFSGSPTPRVNWTRVDQPLSNRTRYESFGQQLTINDVRYEDAGRYECQGINDQTTTPVKRSFDLTVESAPYWVTKPESVNATEGGTATFTCLGEGVPNPSYFWYLNGVPVTRVPDDPRRFQSENTLTFTNLTLEDTQVVQCKIFNKYGYNFTNAYLNVIAPDQSINNVTLWTGEDAKFICNKTLAAENSPFWIMYRQNGKAINSTVLQPSSDERKYAFQDENTTLVVKDVQRYDSATYCCVYPNNRGYCGNLLVVASLNALVDPSDGVTVGDVANLNCSLHYYAPPQSSPYPTSDKQYPKLSMFIDAMDITANVRNIVQTIGPDPYFNSISMAQNKTILQSDGKSLVCRVSSINPQIPPDRNSGSAPLNIKSPAEALIVYPKNVSTDVYPIGAVFGCYGNGYPQATAAWVDLSTGQRLNDTDGNATLVVINNGNNATLELNDYGTFHLNCSAWNSLNVFPSNKTIHITAGQQNSAILSEINIHLLGSMIAFMFKLNFQL